MLFRVLFFVSEAKVTENTGIAAGNDTECIISMPSVRYAAVRSLAVNSKIGIKGTCKCLTINLQ